MGEGCEPGGETTFKDVLLARRYLREVREHGQLSPDLQAAVKLRKGAVEKAARIIEVIERIRGEQKNNG